MVNRPIRPITRVSNSNSLISTTPFLHARLSVQGYVNRKFSLPEERPPPIRIRQTLTGYSRKSIVAEKPIEHNAFYTLRKTQKRRPEGRLFLLAGVQFWSLSWLCWLAWAVTVAPATMAPLWRAASRSFIMRSRATMMASTSTTSSSEVMVIW